MLKVVQDAEASNENTANSSLLDEIVRDGARQMLATALQAEVMAYVEAFADEVDEHGRRLVVRNGYHAERELVTAAGAVPVPQPRVNDKRIDPAAGERRGSPRRSCPRGHASRRGGRGVATAVPARPLLLRFRAGAGAVPRHRAWVVGGHGHPADQGLAGRGVRADGAKELIALGEGHRESSESWADLLRSCKRCGMRAPVLAVGDGALGFWKALRDVFADTKEQRCWWHKIGNVLAALPKSAHKDAKAALAEIYNAEDRDHAEQARKAFAAAYGAKWPKAVAKITNDLDVPLAFYDFPGKHWIHLRTTNPIESTFATVRLRQRVTKGPGSRAAGIAMAFKLIESAQHP